MQSDVISSEKDAAVRLLENQHVIDLLSCIDILAQ